MVEGNTQHRYKEAMSLLEERSPGTKQQMYFGFLKRAAPRFAGDDDAEVVACSNCGAPTVAWEVGDAVCSFCKTKALAARRKAGRDPGASRARRRR